MTTLARLSVIAFPVHFAWELLQAPAFGSMGPTWMAGLLVCARAAAGDVIIVAGLLGLGILLFRDGRWFTPMKPWRYVLITAVATGIQSLVEHTALAAGWWTYQNWHPTFLGVGLLPVIQGAVLTPPIFGLLGHWER